MSFTSGDSPACPPLARLVVFATEAVLDAVRLLVARPLAASTYQACRRTGKPVGQRADPILAFQRGDPLPLLHVVTLGRFATNRLPARVFELPRVEPGAAVHRAPGGRSRAGSRSASDADQKASSIGPGLPRRNLRQAALEQPANHGD